jgi:hypothetical protein
VSGVNPASLQVVNVILKLVALDLVRRTKGALAANGMKRPRSVP